jgi:hypothetical protein
MPYGLGSRRRRSEPPKRRLRIAYLANTGALAHAQEMAAHASPRTIKLYDRAKGRLTQDEAERIRLQHSVEASGKLARTGGS